MGFISIDIYGKSVHTIATEPSEVTCSWALIDVLLLGLYLTPMEVRDLRVQRRREEE